MLFYLLATLSLVACASADYEVESLVGYHVRVAIPMAKKIKAAEDAILANRNPNARIVGGTVSKPNAHPYMGGLLITYANNPGMGVCGSVLVTRHRLLTAAHCWFDRVVQANRFVVVVGSDYLFSGGDRIATSTVVTHPGWNPENSHNNLAVIYLPYPVILSKNVQPIAIATNTSETYVGYKATAVGFGRTSDKQTSVAVSSVISEMEAPVITVADCRRIFSRFAQPNTICTSGTGGVGICRGDGGGPLFIKTEKGPLLIGVSTFLGKDGCELGLPSGFARVTSFRDFIFSHI